MPRLLRRLVSLLLTTVAVAMGPGLSLVEARLHANARSGSQEHGRREHFEAMGGQDHGDRCTAGIATSPAKPSPCSSASVRVPEPSEAAPAPTRIGFVPSVAARIHPPRGPPTVL